MNERMQRQTIEAEAIEQFLRLNESLDDARRAAEFSEWLTRSPTHVEVFLAVVHTWSALNLPAEGSLSTDALIAAARAEPAADNVVELPRPMPLQQRMPDRHVAHAWRAAVAAAVLAVVGWIGYAYVTAAHLYRNDSEEVRRVPLPDGSLVSLNPNSEIYLRWTNEERRLDLRHGRARFQVAKNPQRPFLVDTDLGTVRAVGTIFDVDTQLQETRITVIEGRVEVERVAHVGLSTKGVGADAGNSSLQLSAGDRATISGGEAAITEDAAPSMMAWTAQRVVFRGATLDVVIDEFNRYQGRPAIIDDAGLAPLVISGVFDPKNPDSLLSYLELYEGVQVERTVDGSVRLSRRR